MKQIVYVDVLILLNSFIDCLILLSVSKFLGKQPSIVRIVLGSFFGGISSLYVLLPKTLFIFTIIYEIFISCAITLITFKLSGKKDFIKTIVCFFSISFSFGGIIYATCSIFNIRGVVLQGGMVYFYISPFILILCTSIAYVLVKLICLVTGKANTKDGFCRITIEKNGKQCKILAKYDSANDLREPFSNLPVIVVGVKYLDGLFDKEEIKEYLQCKKTGYEILAKKTPENYRIIPFSTISDKGTLIAFKADYVHIKKNKKDINIDAYIGICPYSEFMRNVQALINPNII